MASAVSLVDMETAVRETSDTENDPHPRDETIRRYVNRAIAKLYNKLVRARGDEYYAVQATIATVASTETVALPATFFKLVSARRRLTATSFRPMWRASVKEIRSFTEDTQIWTDETRILYSPYGANLLLYPTPQGVFNIDVDYIPAAPILDDPADTFDGISGWEDWVILSAARRVLIQRQESTAEVDQELAELNQEIEALAGTRDEGLPSMVQDVEGNMTSVDADLWLDQFTNVG